MTCEAVMISQMREVHEVDYRGAYRGRAEIARPGADVDKSLTQNVWGEPLAEVRKRNAARSQAPTPPTRGNGGVVPPTAGVTVNISNSPGAIVQIGGLARRRVRTVTTVREVTTTIERIDEG